MNRPAVWGLGAVLVVGLMMAALVWPGLGRDEGLAPSGGDAAMAPGTPGTPDKAPAPVVLLPPAEATSAASASAPVAPAALMADYRDSGGRSHAKHAGKRLSLRGAVVSIESGENGLVMVSLDAGPDLPAARAVMAASDAARVRDWQQGTAVVLDCANQGLLMGEPLLADCRAVKD